MNVHAAEVCCPAEVRPSKTGDMQTEAGGAVMASKRKKKVSVHVRLKPRMLLGAGAILLSFAVSVKDVERSCAALL